jgi:DNA-binding PadR family transcriptional regulator
MKTAPMRRLEKHLTGGNLWLYILALLKKGKRHAYALDEEIYREFSFKPNKIMIYVVLYKLESEGMIDSKFEGRRKYYNITKKGIQTINKGKKYLKELSEIL